MEELDALLETAQDKLVVIDFYADNCAPCQRVAPLFQELSDEFADAVLFLKVNVDQQAAIATKYQITGWPAFVFIKQGKVLTEIVGGNLAEATLYDWVKLLMPKEQADDEEGGGKKEEGEE